MTAFQTGACPYCRGIVEVATAAPPGAPITCHHCATPSRVWQVLAARRRLEADGAPILPATAIQEPLRLNLRCGDCGHWWTQDAKLPANFPFLYCPNCGRTLKL